MKTGIKAVAGRVLVLPEKHKEETKTESGIILKEKMPKQKTGTVIHTGDCNELKVCDKVYFGRNSGIEFEFKGETYLNLKIDEILAVCVE